VFLAWPTERLLMRCSPSPGRSCADPARPEEPAHSAVRAGVLPAICGYALNHDIRNIRLAVRTMPRRQPRSDLGLRQLRVFRHGGDVVDSGDVTGILIAATRARCCHSPRFGADAASGRPTALQIPSTATTPTGHRRGGYAVGLMAVSARYSAGALGRRLDRALTLGPASRNTPSCAARFPRAGAHRLHRDAHGGRVPRALGGAREGGRHDGADPHGADRGPGLRPGKTAPYFFISLASAVGVIGVSMLLFDLPVRGSWLALLGCVSLFLVGALAFGLLISTIAPSQQVAFQIALLTSFLPTLMLSGFIFPISSMPTFLQVITHVVPARYFLVILRGLLLKGVELRLLWTDVASLTVFSLVVLALASIRLKREWA
jgi:hypothetical protein